MSALSDLLETIRQNSEQTAKSANTYQSIVERQLDSMNAAATFRAQGTDNKGNTPSQVEAALSGQQAAEQASIRLRNRGGLTGDEADVMLKLIDENNQSFEQAKALQAEVDRKQSVDFFSNPLGYIVNQLTVDEDISKYNSVAHQYNLNVDHMQQLNDMIQEGATTYNATKQTVTDAAIKDATKASLAMIQAEVATMEAQTFATNADAVKTVLGFNNQQLQNASAAYSAYMQDQSLDISRAHLKLAREEAARLRAKEAGNETLALEAYKAGFQSIHGVEPDVKNAKELIELAKISPAAKAKLDIYLDRGVQIKAGILSPGVLGRTPSEAMAVVETLKVPLAPATREVYNNLMLGAQAYFRNPPTPQEAEQLKALKKPEEIQAWFDQKVHSMAKEQKVEIKKGSIYQAPDLKTMLDFKGVNELPAAQKILVPLARSGIKDVTPTELVTYVAKAIQEKKITSNQGVDLITSYYAGANFLNGVAKQYDKIGIPNDGTYRARVKLPGYTPSQLFPGPMGIAKLYAGATGFGEENEVYDLANQVEVKKLLLRANMNPVERSVK